MDKRGLVGLKVGQEWRASWGEGLRKESRAGKCMSEKEENGVIKWVRREMEWV